MVSSDFLASSYIASEELPKMLDALAADGLTIFWIPVRPSSVSAKPDRPFSSRAVSGQATLALARRGTRRSFRQDWRKARTGAWTGRRVTVFSKQ
jgi:hypothetical protein